MRRILCLIAVLLLPRLAGQAAAQERSQLAPPTTKVPEEISVTVGGKVDGKKISGNGAGTCSHAADASIHGVSASLWTVQYAAAKDGSVKQLNLTLWRPKDEGPDQLSLTIDGKSGLYRIETGNPGQTKGEGTVTILPSGPGGRLEIKGKDSGGKPLQLTIDCTAFAGVESEGD
jgi:predicted dehydrogenase